MASGKKFKLGNGRTARQRSDPKLRRSFLSGRTHGSWHTPTGSCKTLPAVIGRRVRQITSKRSRCLENLVQTGTSENENAAAAGNLSSYIRSADVFRR
eukprot:10119601-Karenia_brevis.AAC.1